MGTISDNTPIFEEGEWCEKCGATENVGTWGVKGVTGGLGLCATCYADKRGFKAWLITETEKALAESGDYERTGDGKWKRVAA